MAKIINKNDRKLGFDSDEFQLVVRKPNDGSVWYIVSLQAGENQYDSLWKEEETPKMMAKRLEKTLKLFMDSSYDTLVLTGRVMNNKKEME